MVLIARPYFCQRRKSSPGFLRKYWVSSSSNRQCGAVKGRLLKSQIGICRCCIQSVKGFVDRRSEGNQAILFSFLERKIRVLKVPGDWSDVLKGIWGKERPVPLRPLCESGFMASIICVWVRFRSVGKGREGRAEWTGKGRVGTII